MEEEHFSEFPNFRQNLFKYLLDNDNQCNQWGEKQNISKSKQDLENILKRKLEHKNEKGLIININELVKFFVGECLQNFLPINPSFARYYINLLIRDSQDGLEVNNMSRQRISVCEIEQFLLTALIKYKNQTDATINCMKIAHYCKNSKELILDFTKQKHELDFNKKLKQLTNSILQYPETSSDKQIEELFLKMQMFIVTNYQLGYPENHILLRKCRQSLNSILGKVDIQKYVLKKKYHRLNYLQKLGSTAAGILIFNNQGPESDKENVRNIFADLEMAACNTKDSLQESSDRVTHLKQKSHKVMLQLIEINVQQRDITFLRPLDQLREANKFVILLEVYKKNLEKVKREFEKTQYLIEMHQKKFDCGVKKINEILKYRSAIETEKIFPHFVYLSEIWNSLMLYLTHLVEINKMKDNLDDILHEKLQNEFNELLENLSDESKYLTHPLKISFQDIINSAIKRETNFNMLNIKPFVKDYCALTIVLTGGLLVPSQLEKKLCEDADFCFGFSKIEYSKFAEYHFKDFIQVFRSTILTYSDLIVLFELEDHIMQQDLDLIKQMKARTKSLGVQTEMISNVKLPKNRIDETWNVWDFHRGTIKLANLRKKQTCSAQSNLSFGMRNAQNQFDRKTNNATQK